MSEKNPSEISAVMSQSMKGRMFKILDSHGRFWGTFVVKRETQFFGTQNIHGKLIPADDFEIVRPLFVQHELEMEKEGSVEDVNVDELLELNPYLIDEESNKRVNITGALFITENLWVVCGVENFE